MLRSARRKSRGWLRLLALFLAIALVIEFIVADGAFLRQRNTAYQGNEAYAYLAGRMEYLADNWIERIGNGLALLFYSKDSPTGCARRAGQRASAGDMAGALVWMDKAAAMDALDDRQRGEYALQAACIAALAGQPQDARERAATAARHMPDDPQAQHYLYVFALAAGDSASAAQALEASVNLTGAFDRRREAADLFFEAGDYENAGRLYALVASEADETPELLYRTGLCHMFQGRYEAALDCLNRCEYPGCLYAQGVCHLSLGDSQQAIACFTASVERGEDQIEALLMLAICCIDVKDYARAEALLNAYTARGGQLADVAYYRAVARSMRGDYQGAIADYDLSVSAGAFVDDSLFGAANCRYAIGLYAEAARGFEACVDRGVNLAESWYYLGLSYAATGDSARAENALRMALSLDASIDIGGQ